MITKFDTSAAAGSAAGASKSGNNTALIVIGLVIAGILVYKFVIKPHLDKKKEEAKAAA